MISLVYSFTHVRIDIDVIYLYRIIIDLFLSRNDRKVFSRKFDDLIARTAIAERVKTINSFDQMLYGQERKTKFNESEIERQSHPSHTCVVSICIIVYKNAKALVEAPLFGLDELGEAI